MPCCAHVSAVHVGVGGVIGWMHDVKSKRKNASTFSCAVSALALHSAGKVVPAVFPIDTWKSE